MTEQAPVLETTSQGRTLAGRVRSGLAPLVLLVTLILLWEILVRALGVREFTLPAPSSIAATLVEDADSLSSHFLVTFGQTLLGYGAAVALGIPLAFLIAYSRLAERTLYPLLVTAQSIPKVAIAPILVMWMGFGILPKVVLIILICIFPVVVSCASGLRSTDEEFVELSRSLDASEWQIFRKVRFPAALPQTFVGLKVAMTLAVIGAVVGEFSGADAGLGFVVIIAGGTANTSLAFASILLLSIMSIGLFYALVALERVVVPWAAAER